MKFIMVHGEDLKKHWIDPTKISAIDEEEIRSAPSLHSYIRILDCRSMYCIETPEEIFEKINEAEQREFEKIAEEKQRRERSFMDDWQDRVDKQVGRPAFRKDET